MMTTIQNSCALIKVFFTSTADIKLQLVIKNHLFKNNIQWWWNKEIYSVFKLLNKTVNYWIQKSLIFIIIFSFWVYEMRLLAILCLINFSLCEIVNFDIVSSSSSEESVEDGELTTLELNTAANNDPLNKCLSIKNQNQVSNCVVNICDKKCSQLSDSSSEEKVDKMFIDFTCLQNIFRMNLINVDGAASCKLTVWRWPRLICHYII